jgi:hypothetical protein
MVLRDQASGSVAGTEIRWSSRAHGQLERSKSSMGQAVEEGEHHGDQPRRLHPGWSRRWQGVSGPFSIPQLAASFQLLMAWFAALSSDVERLIASGHRLAQEWVNLGVLQADASWLDASIPS